MKEFKILSPSGIVGYGFPEESFAAGVALKPDLIACDGGSTDPGPYYLGSGIPFTNATAVKRDLRLMLKAARELRVPLVIGTAGGCGADVHVAREVGIIREIAKEESTEIAVCDYISCMTDDFAIDTNKVSNAIRCGGYGSTDKKHTWDIIKEPIALDEQDKCLRIDGSSPKHNNRVIEPNVLTPKRTEYGKQIRKNYESGAIKESRHNMTVLEPKNDGISNTITTVQKDNYVVEPKVIQEPMNLYSNSDNPQSGRIYNAEGISPTMDTCTGGNRMPKIKDNYRIRRLTPRECWRLMGVKDEQFEKLHDLSNTQLYKLAGNSIVVDVLMGIFRNLFVSLIILALILKKILVKISLLMKIIL